MPHGSVRIVMRMSARRSTLLVMAATVLVGLSSHSKASIPVVDAVRLDDPPRIDGVLDDRSWRTAARIPALAQATPLQGAPPTEHTEVWIGYDDQNLYVAFRCADRNPAEILASQLERDTDLNTDDVVRVVLDPSARGRDGYFFEVNALGTRRDELIQEGNTLVSEWDAIWTAAAHVDEGGWSAEIAIPFKSLAFEPDVTTWGLNFERLIRRRQERDRWAGAEVAKRVWWLPDAGRLVGLSGLARGAGLDVKLVTTARQGKRASDADDALEMEPGMDAVWRITPALAATFTVNTDFAEADVDAREVNLTRFPLFFPERRDFFLQDASLFQFGGIEETPRPFFSRRIGLTDGGEPVDVRGGVKLTGRSGPWTIGLLHTELDASETTPAVGLSVGRVAYQLSPTINIGTIATHGDPRFDGDADLVGTDFSYLNTQFWPEKTLEVRMWAMQSDTEFAGGRGNAFGAFINYPNEPWDFSLFAGQYDKRFDPALGFVERTDIRELKSRAQRRFRLERHGVSTIDLFGEFLVQTDLDGRTVAWDLEFPQVLVTTPRGDTLQVGAELERDVLLEPFEITDGVNIPAGDHRFRRWTMEAIVNPSRPVAGALFIEGGEFYTGRREDYGAQLDWRPAPRFYTQLAYEWRNVHLPEGDFEVHIGSLRMNVGVLRNLTWNTTAQYDSISRQVGFNVRLRWSLPMDNDVFLVLNHGFDADDGRLHAFAREAVLKVGWTFRL
jgi:hypothetical protein